MPLVRDEIAKDVPHIQWQVAPHVGSGRRDRPAVLTTELQQAGDAVAAAPQRGQELPSSDPVPIDRGWDEEPVWLAEGFDPPAAGIVNVTGDHADPATGRARHVGSPERGRQVLEEEEGDAIVGPPGGQNRFAEIRWGGITHLSTMTSLLHRPDVAPGLEQMGREGVPQGLRCLEPTACSGRTA